MTVGRTAPRVGRAQIPETRRFQVRQLRCSAAAPRQDVPAFGKVNVILGKRRFTIQVTDPVLKLGRKEDNHIIIDIERDRYADLLGYWVSRHHLEFRRDAQGKLWVKDIATKATILDGATLSHEEKEISAPLTSLRFGGNRREGDSLCFLPEMRVHKISGNEITVEMIPNKQYVPLSKYYWIKLFDQLLLRPKVRMPISLVQKSPTQVGLVKRYLPF